MSKKAAELTAESIRKNPNCLISFPGGDTPLGFMQEFVRMVNAGEVDISQTRYVSLDEWIGLSNSDEGSCGCFNMKNMINALEKPFLDIHIIDGAAEDIEAEREKLDAYIEKYGPLEVSVLGIGLNGHLGFNESGVDFGNNAHIIPLADSTKGIMDKYFGDRFAPTHGITQGIKQIMQAKKVIVIANGEKKADIVSRAVHGEVTNEVPASILQTHPDSYIVVDKEAGMKV